MNIIVIDEHLKGSDRWDGLEAIPNVGDRVQLHGCNRVVTRIVYACTEEDGQNVWTAWVYVHYPHELPDDI